MAAMVSSRDLPHSTARLVTSAMLTQERNDPGKRGMMTLAPFSSKRTASSADASRTTLLTVLASRFFPAFANQLIDYADAGFFIRRERFLYFADDLQERDDVQ